MSCLSNQSSKIETRTLTQTRAEINGQIIGEAPCSFLQPELNFSNLPKVCVPTKDRGIKRFNSVYENCNEDRVCVISDGLTVYLSKAPCPKKYKDYTYYITILKNKVGVGQNQLFLTVPLIQPQDGVLHYTILTVNGVKYHEIYIYNDDCREKRIVIKLNDHHYGNIFTQKVIPIVSCLCEHNIITQFHIDDSSSKEYNEVSPENIANLLIPPTACPRETEMAANNDSSDSSVLLDNKPYSLKSLTLEQIREIGEVLKTAIYSGNIEQSKQIAARFASERIKLDIKVDEKSLGGSVNDVFSLSVVVEDRESGSSRPIKLKVTAKDTIKDLKLKFFMNYHFPLEVQKWIIDKKLPLDGDTLNQHKIRGPGHTAYVYIMTAKSVNLTEYNYQQQLNTRKTPQPGRSLTMPRSHAVISGDYMSMSTPAKSRSFSFKQKADLPNNTYVNSCMAVSPTALEDIIASEPSLHAYEPVETVNCLRYQDTRNNGSLALSLSQNGPPTLPKPAKIIKSPEILKPIGWTCPQCTYINIPTRPGCEMCSEDRPIDYTIPTEYVLSNEERERIEREQEIERRMQEDVITERVDSTTQQRLSERELDLVLKFNDAIQTHETDQDSYDMEDDYDVIPPSPIITRSFGDGTS